MIGKGNLHENLYILESSFSKSTSSSSIIPSQIHTTFQISAEVWHQRLGHPSPNKIHILSKELHILSEKSVHESVCKVCPLAKQKSISFQSSNNMSPFPFDLIHLDIWGPFHEPTNEGYKYFLTIVDDCTRATWVYLLKNKSYLLLLGFTLIIW